ncbi:MAG TPA: LLM class flavin-dependent oxidoreductase [Actinomycetota bacterium]|nr:LLM class flavin-dependent oxidoreductase [Actinomycetota bacterium]
MRFGLFYEHHLPSPWDEGAEEQLLLNALEQVELADRLGFDYVWEVEHHFLEEYSHSSAPEVFLAAASQRTNRIRLGHGIVQLPPAINHPARTAERIATLDLISGGRVEFGTGEGSSQAELGAFGVDREHKRSQWEEMLDVVTRMMVEEPFAGHESKWMFMPPRNVVPKPKQKPHPPLWAACSQRDTIITAARKGLGALSFSFVEPEDAKPWVDDYYRVLTSEKCVPGGFSVNPNVAVVIPFMCHADEATAIERGIDGAHFFGYSLAHYYAFGRHRPGETNIGEEFSQQRTQYGFARDIIRPEGENLGVRILEQGLGSMRGAVGTPAQIRDLMRRYEAVGVDQIIFVSQAGSNKHEHVCESLELFAREVLPDFATEADAIDERRMERLEEACSAALARRSGARSLSEPYVITAYEEPNPAVPQERSREIKMDVATQESSKDIAARQKGAPAVADDQQFDMSPDLVTPEQFAQLIASAENDDQIREVIHQVGTDKTLDRVFEGFEQRFVPERAEDVSADVMFVVKDNDEEHSYTISIKDKTCTAKNEAIADPRTTLTTDLASFLKLIAGVEDGMKLFMGGKLKVSGDLMFSTRLMTFFDQPKA